MNAIPPKGMKPGRGGPTRPRPRPGEPAAGIAIAVDGEADDPVPEILEEPEGIPDPAVFEAFMPKGEQAGLAGSDTAIDDAEAAGTSAGDGTARGTSQRPVGGRGSARRTADGPIPAHLAGIEVVVSVEVGRTRLPLGELLDVEPGQLFDLDTLVDEPVSILVNGRPFATGEIMAVGDRFGVRIVALEDPGP